MAGSAGHPAVNKNGVRDEVELILSKRISNDDDYFITIAAAKSFQDMLMKPARNREEGLAQFAADGCATAGMKGFVYYGEPGVTPWSEKKYSIDTLTFNTYERRLVYSQLVRMVGGILGSELPSCK